MDTLIKMIEGTIEWIKEGIPNEPIVGNSKHNSEQIKRMKQYGLIHRKLPLKKNKLTEYPKNTKQHKERHYKHQMMKNIKRACETIELETQNTFFGKADTDESQTTAIQEDNQNTTYEFDSNPSESTSEQNGEGGTGGQEPNEEDDHPEQPPEETNESTTTTPAQYICAECQEPIDGATSYMQWTTAILPHRLVPQQICCSHICAEYYCINYISQHVNEIRATIRCRDPMMIIARMRTAQNERTRQEISQVVAEFGDTELTMQANVLIAGDTGASSSSNQPPSIIDDLTNGLIQGMVNAITAEPQVQLRQNAVTHTFAVNYIITLISIMQSHPERRPQIEEQLRNALDASRNLRTRYGVIRPKQPPAAIPPASESMMGVAAKAIGSLTLGKVPPASTTTKIQSTTTCSTKYRNIDCELAPTNDNRRIARHNSTKSIGRKWIRQTT